MMRHGYEYGTERNASLFYSFRRFERLILLVLICRPKRLGVVFPLLQNMDVLLLAARHVLCVRIVCIVVHTLWWG